MKVIILGNGETKFKYVEEYAKAYAEKHEIVTETQIPYTEAISDYLGPGKKELGYELWTLPASVPEFNAIADRCFELHHYSEFRRVGKPMGRPEGGFVKDLKKLTCPLYLQEQHDSFTTSIRFPVEELVGKFRRYFDGTIAYMMALAIDEGADEIALYGIDLAKEEYKNQKPAMEYWVGYAEGKGIKVHIPGGSALNQRDSLYCYDYPLPSNVKPLSERLSA